MLGSATSRATEARVSERTPAVEDRAARPHTGRSAHGTTQRVDIQGMRAVAVLLVVIAHAHILHFFEGGYVGVDVFFVISGFLITGVLEREVRKTGRVSFALFYARRARRILPAASLVLVVVMLASALVYTDGHLDKVAKDVGWAAFFAANIHFAAAGSDYFAINSFETPVQHFWSLAVEEQFYLLWPALIAAMLILPWRRRAWRRKDQSDRAPDARAAQRRAQALRRSALLIAILCAGSLLWSVHDTLTSPQSAYYSTFTRGWELGLGALLALGAHRVGRLPDPVKAVMSWTGLAAVLVAAVKFTPDTPFPGSAALLPVLGSVLMIAGGIDGPQFGATKVLGLRPMRFVGDISYSLYLWHWPLLILPAAYAEDTLRIRYKLLLIAVAILVSWASYRWVETPLRTSHRLKRGNLRALALWPAGLAVVLISTMLVYQTTVAQAPTPPKQTQERVMSNPPDRLRSDVVKAAEKAQNDAPLPHVLNPKLVNLAQDRTEPADGCWAQDRGATSHKICPLGDTDASKTVVIWGDSHAGQWLKPLDTLAKKNHIKLLPIEKAACAPVDVTPIFHGSKYSECEPFRGWALKQIKRIQPDMVILAGQISIRYVDPDTGEIASDERGTELFSQGAKRTLEKLNRLTPKVTVMSDQTKLPEDSETCLGARSADMGTCAKPVNERTKQRDLAWKKAAHATGNRFANLQPWLCADDTCPVIIDGMVVYRDKHHLTTTYAQHLQPVLADQLKLSKV